MNYLESSFYLSHKPLILFLIFFSISLTLCGCQSNLHQAGESHKKTVEKWLELSKYGESRLVEYGVTITAQLSLEAEDNKYRYKLSNFTLNNHENSFNINVLYPSFENKYLCAPLCMQLIEYDRHFKISGGTLLDQYFSKHEYELFKFYGEVYQLNEKISELHKVAPTYVEAFLHDIVEEKKGFESPQGIISYLKERVTTEALVAYSSNPPLKLSYSNFIRPSESDQWRPIKNHSKPQEKPLPQESKNWSISASGNDGINEKVGLAIESFNWNPINSDIIARRSKVNWKKAKKQRIKIGHTACSYNQNFFGIIVSINNEFAEINVIGQAKILQDGVIKDAEKGYLYGGNQEIISFFPIHKKLPIKQSDIAPCDLS